MGSLSSLRWIVTPLSFLSLLLSGVNWSFNAYALPLKETFNFSQTKVEIIASTNTIGSGFAFLGGLVTLKFGYAANFICVFTLLCLSSGSLSIMVYWKEFFAVRALAIYFAHFILAASTAVAVSSITVLNVKSFPLKHTGKLIGLQSGLLSLSKIVFAGFLDIFYYWKFWTFFLAIFLVNFILHGLCFVSLYTLITLNVIPINNITEDSIFLHDENNHEGNASPSEKDVFHSTFFHLTLWPSAFFYACAFTCMNNITIIAESVGFPNPVRTVYVIALITSATRITFGILFDFVSSVTSPIALMVVTYMSFAVAMCVGTLSSGSEAKIWTVTILSGVSMGSGKTVPISVLAIHFGTTNLALITGSFFASLAVFQVFLQLLVGFLYDAQGGNPLPLFPLRCLGDQCFQWCFIIMLIVTLVIIIIQSISFTLFVKYPSCFKNIEDPES